MVDETLPLSALLSQALTAFIIEFDNEFEHQAPHRTSKHGSTPGSLKPPWLVSMAMWWKFLRFIPDDGIRLDELRQMFGITAKEMQMRLVRMVRWRYVAVWPDEVIRPTPGGRRALAVWRPLIGTIERRWNARFGEVRTARLRESLGTVADQMDAGLPDFLPILGYGLFSREDDGPRVETVPPPLVVLLSKVLLGFAIEFERESKVSLAISANILRLAGEEGVRVRDLPRLSGVSKEAIATALSFLEKRGYADVQTESAGSRFKVVVLRAEGMLARETYLKKVWAIEKLWQERYGGENIRRVRESLEAIAGELFRGLEPYADGWRASIARPETLPHYPMILHRGGYPDGS